MDSALAVTGLVMGLAGGPHCVAMCSAACGGIARACGGPRPWRAMLALHAGRLASYAAGGAVAAGSVSALAQWAPAVAWLHPLWSMVHLAAFALGVWLLWTARQPGWLSTLGQQAGRPLEVRPIGKPRLSGISRAALAGSLWVAWPCGLLQSALMVAALASGPVWGASVMAAFAIGSAASLWAGPLLWARLVGVAGGSGGHAAQAMGVRLAGLVLAGASLWALAQAFGVMRCSSVCT